MKRFSAHQGGRKKNRPFSEHLLVDDSSDEDGPLGRQEVKQSYHRHTQIDGSSEGRLAIKRSSVAVPNSPRKPRLPATNQLSTGVAVGERGLGSSFRDTYAHEYEDDDYTELLEGVGNDLEGVQPDKRRARTGAVSFSSDD